MKSLTPILALVLGAWIVYDLWLSLRTGRARGRFGTIERKSQPKQFGWYIICDAIVLAFCIGVIGWWIND